MNIVERMKNGEKLSLGMVHTQPLPGSFKNKLSIDEIVKLAVEDAINLEKAGFDAVIVENVNDAPYDLNNPLPTQKVAALARICTEVKKAVSIPVGLDACGNQIAGFDIASMTGIEFIRLSNLCDIRISNKGIVNPCGGEAVLHRKAIGAENVMMFADIQVKHTFPLVEVPLETSAGWAVGSGADVIIVTGAETGMETSLEALERVKKVVKVPVVAGSGVNTANVKEQYSVCDGAIIGSSLKQGKSLMNPIDLDLAKEFIKAAKE